MIKGDFNTDIQGQSRFITHLNDVILYNDLLDADSILLPSESFTYISEAHGSTTTSLVVICVTVSMEIYDDQNFPSDHVPICGSAASLVVIFVTV